MRVPSPPFHPPQPTPKANPLGNAAAPALAQSTHLGALFRLLIGPCNLTDEGLKALWNSTHPTSLKDLHC